MTALRTAAIVTLLAAPAHAGGYVAIVPDFVPIAAPAAPSGVPPELLVAGGLALLFFMLRDNGGGHHAVPPAPQPAPVPLPPAGALLLTGLLGFAAWRKLA